MAVEFSTVKDGNMAFVYVDRPAQKDAVRTWLKDTVGQEIIAESAVDGHPVIITRGDKTQADIMKLLAERGETLQPHVEKKPLDLWKLRSIASVAGQSLQIFSGMRRGNMENGVWVPRKDQSLLIFAGLNMTANIMGYVLGAQKVPDTNHLQYLKDQLGRQMEPAVEDGQHLPDIQHPRLPKREGPPPHKTAGENFKAFLQRNSVTIGEIGMRYVAAIGLLFPMFKNEHHIGWGGIWELSKKGEFKEAWAKGVNRLPLFRYAAIGYVAGKFIALFTKVKDPYEHKEHTWVDTMREDVLFKLGSIIEATSGAVISYNGFKNGQIKGFDGKPMRDYAGGFGGAIFATGYMIRLGAKFGEKQFNMKELQAYLGDSFARIKPEELPQVMADSVAATKNHFKDKSKLTFGDMYTQVLTDMYKHHKVTLTTLAGTPEEQKAKMDSLTLTTPKLAQTAIYDAEHPDVPQSTVEGEKTYVLPEKKLLQEQVKQPAANHVEHAVRETTTERGVA